MDYLVRAGFQSPTGIDEFRNLLLHAVLRHRSPVSVPCGDQPVREQVEAGCPRCGELPSGGSVSVPYEDRWVPQHMGHVDEIPVPKFPSPAGIDALRNQITEGGEKPNGLFQSPTG